jgi:antitoxin YefM
MITAIREVSTINGGQIVLPPLDFPDGTRAEVIVLVEDEMDATEYLMSTEANRKHLLDAIKEGEEHPERRIVYNNLDELKKDFPTT